MKKGGGEKRGGRAENARKGEMKGGTRDGTIARPAAAQGPRHAASKGGINRQAGRAEARS